MRLYSSYTNNESAYMKKFFKKYWNGEYSLAFSYWVVGLIFSAMVMFSISYWTDFIDTHGNSLTYSAWAIVFYAVGILIYQVWFTVGAWRSATRYNVESIKTPIWGNVAKFAIVISCFQCFALFSNTVYPSIKASYVFLLGGDEFKEVALEIIDEGKTLKINGIFGNNSFNKIQKYLNENESVKRLYLNSNGGRLKEVTLITSLIKVKKLDTYVEDNCLSFCTVVFLAGEKRFATPTSKIGFHAPVLRGAEEFMSKELNQQSKDLYDTFNLPHDFVEKIFATPNTEMWYPSFQYLVEIGVVNKISTGGESTIVSKGFGKSKSEIKEYLSKVDLFKKIDNKFPNFLEDMAVAALPLIEQNKSDAEVFNAIRLIAHGYLAKAVANSNTEIRIKYLSYVYEQAKAISKLGSDICFKYMQSQLDITKVLPIEFVKKELDIFDEALESKFELPRGYSKNKYESLMQVVGSKLTSQELNALQNPDVKNGLSNCSAGVNFYKEINMLNGNDKDLVIYAMFNNL
jgi:hypothetical protein